MLMQCNANISYQLLLPPVEDWNIQFLMLVPPDFHSTKLHVALPYHRPRRHQSFSRIGKARRLRSWRKKRFIEDTVTKDFEPWFGDLKPKEFIDKLNRQIQCYNNRKPSYDEKSDDELLCMVLGEVLIIMNIDSMINCWTCDDFMKRYKGLVVYLQELFPMKNVEEIKNIFTKCLLQMQTYLGAFLKWKPGNHKTNLPGNSKRTHTRYRTSKVRRVRPAIFLPSQ